MPDVRTISETKEAAEFIADSILDRLKSNKKVIWLVPGGSAIRAAVEAAKIISSQPHRNLTVSLTDERLGPAGHPDSNWRELKEGGFSLPEAKLIPVIGTADWVFVLEKEFKNNDYRIGLFGIGVDGHTAGLLPPGSASKFDRISISNDLIGQLDEVVLYAEGKEKEDVINKLSEDIDIKIMPAQVLKRVPKLTVFHKI